MYDHGLQTYISQPISKLFGAKFSQIPLSHSYRFKAYSVPDTANQYTRLVLKILISELVFSNLIFGLLVHVAKKHSLLNSFCVHIEVELIPQMRADGKNQIAATCTVFVNLPLITIYPWLRQMGCSILTCL